jgi:hypothetical protein
MRKDVIAVFRNAVLKAQRIHELYQAFPTSICPRVPRAAHRRAYLNTNGEVVGAALSP